MVQPSSWAVSLRSRKARDFSGSMDTSICPSQLNSFRYRGHAPVFLHGPGQPLGDIGDMGGDLRGHDAFPDILQGRQPQMFGRGDVAEEIRPGSAGNGAADGRRDVVVAGGDVRRQGTQDIKGRPVAERLSAGGYWPGSPRGEHGRALRSWPGRRRPWPASPVRPEGPVPAPVPGPWRRRGSRAAGRRPELRTIS